MKHFQNPAYSHVSEDSEDGSDPTTEQSSANYEDASLSDSFLAMPHKCKCLCGKHCPCESVHGRFGFSKPPAEKSTKTSKLKSSCFPRFNRVCLFMCLILSVFGLVFSYFFVGPMLQDFVEGRLILQEGSDRFNGWESGEPPALYKIWVFNVTNRRSFMRGARPILREVGPYVYEVKEVKEHVSFGENDTLTFSPRPIFKFIESLSGGSEDDFIFTLNIPLVNAGVQVENSLLLQNILKIASRIHGFPPLKYLTVRQLLWGHQSKVLDWARRMKEVPYPFEEFGLMAGKNNTIQPPYTVDTGASDHSQILKVKLYKGKSSLGVWGSPACDAIQGTIVGGFHPRIVPSETLQIFSGQLCRSLPLVFEKTVNHSGLEAFRFIPSPHTFDYGDSFPSNQCFCEGKLCPPKGVMDVRACYFGAAIAFSFPHFYQADPVLRHVVRGLRPDPELHGTQFDIYPALGVPLRVKLRMQMNVVIDGNQALQRARHFDVVFPVFWFEAGIDSLPGEMVGMLKMAQDLPSVVKTTSVTVCTTLTVLFLLLLLASSLAGWCGITPESSRTHTPDHLPDTHWQTPHPIISTSNYAPGSLGSLGPDDSYRTVLPPYRKAAFFPDDREANDGFQNVTFKSGPPSEDQPPAYTSAPDASKVSSASLLSVEIHKSASLHSLEDTSSHTEIVEDDSLQKLPPNDSTKENDDDDEEEEEEDEKDPNGFIPVPPPPPLASSPSAPLSKEENESMDTPLATSSPQESPNTTTDPPIPPPELRTFSCRGQPSRPPPLESDL